MEEARWPSQCELSSGPKYAEASILLFYFPLEWRVQTLDATLTTFGGF
jgi:hypothetical protein